VEGSGGYHLLYKDNYDYDSSGMATLKSKKIQRKTKPVQYAFIKSKTGKFTSGELNVNQVESEKKNRKYFQVIGA